MYTPYLYPNPEGGFSGSPHWHVGEGGIPMAIPLGYVLRTTWEYYGRIVVDPTFTGSFGRYWAGETRTYAHTEVPVGKYAYNQTSPFGPDVFDHLLAWIPGYLPPPPPLNMYFPNFTDFHDRRDPAMWDTATIPDGMEVMPVSLNVYGDPATVGNYGVDPQNLYHSIVSYHNRLRPIPPPTGPAPGFWWPAGVLESETQIPWGKELTPSAIESGFYNLLQFTFPYLIPPNGYWVPIDGLVPEPIPVGYRLRVPGTFKPYDTIERIPPKLGHYFPYFTAGIGGLSGAFPIPYGFEADPSVLDYQEVRVRSSEVRSSEDNEYHQPTTKRVRTGGTWFA